MRSDAFLRPQALLDLEQIFIYLAENDLDAADRFLLSFENSVKLISGQPNVGAEASFENPQLQGIRTWPVKGHKKVLIFYFAANDRLDVVRVLHTARDIRGILEG